MKKYLTIFCLLLFVRSVIGAEKIDTMYMFTHKQPDMQTCIDLTAKAKHTSKDKIKNLVCLFKANKKVSLAPLKNMSNLNGITIIGGTVSGLQALNRSKNAKQLIVIVKNAKVVGIRGLINPKMLLTFVNVQMNDWSEIVETQVASISLMNMKSCSQFRGLYQLSQVDKLYMYFKDSSLSDIGDGMSQHAQNKDKPFVTLDCPLEKVKS